MTRVKITWGCYWGWVCLCGAGECLLEGVEFVSMCEVFQGAGKNEYGIHAILTSTTQNYAMSYIITKQTISCR